MRHTPKCGGERLIAISNVCRGINVERCAMLRSKSAKWQLVAEKFGSAAVALIAIDEWALWDLQSWMNFRELFHFDGKYSLIIESCSRAPVPVDGIEDGLHDFIGCHPAAIAYNFLDALWAELFSRSVDSIQNSVT